MVSFSSHGRGCLVYLHIWNSQYAQPNSGLGYPGALNLILEVSLVVIRPSILGGEGEVFLVNCKFF